MSEDSTAGTTSETLPGAAVNDLPLAEAVSEPSTEEQYGSGRTEYEKYLKTPELLSLQKPRPRRNHDDELMFQCVHQIEELWMKVAIQSIGGAIEALDEHALDRTRAHLERATRAQEQCREALRMFETMPPHAYLEIRRGLGRGSGMDSPGFNRLGEVALELWPPFADAVDRSGVTLLSLYQNPGRDFALFSLAETMVSLDAQMMRFKREHMMVVQRIVGQGTASLRGGNPLEMLDRSARQSFFPLLWAVRERLFMDFKAGPLQSW